ncbi:DUF5688 family protein [Oribacterium sp. C9]|uniref:DUF5688 family protein n=1 Tax=Oribacterium sp. C9 TaxID=1943579 RepID=UPI001FA82D1D|nr:DUF5688 family protein [Oribacterium sp. C9]
MKHIVVDLEMNSIRKKDDARRICNLETIEIGAVMLDDNLQEISSFRTYVKPEHCDGIARNISRLTGITDDMVLNAPKFNESLRMFTNWCLGTGDEVTVYAWSDSDYMAVVYRFVIDSDNDSRATILATNQLVEHFGITPEQLHADAMENAPRIKPAEIKGMGEVIAEMMGVDKAEMDALYHVSPEDEQIFVASVPDKVHGAGVLAYQGFMDQAAERVGGDFFVLPSSIHEILIVPDNGKMGLSDLENMVRDVNATQVDPVDKLTDNVYHYDSQAKIFELGEKFVERQNERDEPDMEKDEKGSVLDDLKAKKDEIAKAPKKESVDKSTKDKGGEAI